MQTWYTMLKNHHVRHRELLQEAQQLALFSLELGLGEAMARHALCLGEQHLERELVAVLLDAGAEGVDLPRTEEAALAGGGLS